MKLTGGWLCWRAQFRFSVAEARSGLPTARTTVMIKNVPNKYTQRMLLDTFDRRFRYAVLPLGCILRAACAATCPAVRWARAHDICRVGPVAADERTSRCTEAGKVGLATGAPAGRPLTRS